MIRCNSCGSENIDNLVNCSNCGKPFAISQNAVPIYAVECANCHQLNPSNVQFCGNCGASFNFRPAKVSIGGWLVLPVIGLYATIIVAIIGFVSSVIILGDDYAPSRLVPIIYFELVINLVFVIFGIYCLILLYQKKRLFPKVMIGFYIIGFVLGLADVLWVLSVIQASDLTSSIITKIIAPAIWIPYLLISKRVKSTFVN